MIGTLKSSEIAVLRLRSLYESRGYQHFKMSKFEEYDMYAANKDFLGGEGIITFTDPNGKLMALKPDVTMSIIKNSKDEDGLTEKLYYNENVYRAPAGSHHFEEIMQSGLECIGDIDLYNTCEVISLAAKSLALFELPYVLDISHMGILSRLIDKLGVDLETKKNILKCIGAKNTHELSAILKDGESELVRLLSLDTDPNKAISELEKICEGDSVLTEALNELKSIVSVLISCGANPGIRIDFSVVQDITYYNGVVFQGFIMGISEKVLTGGRYDLLMKRIGKSKGAIGFGVNVNSLEKVFDSQNEFDADAAIIYKPEDDVSAVMAFAEKLSAQGQRVAVTTKIPERARYRQIQYFCDGGKR